MPIDPVPFQRYRSSPNEKTTIWRLIVGTIVVVAFWIAATIAVMFAGIALFQGAGSIEAFAVSPAGILTALTSFAGIWIGVWVAMRFIHREPLSALFGNSRRVSWDGFAKGLIAVLITSVISEVLLYALYPGMQRGAISMANWLLFLVPIMLLTLLQTSSEELLFRGYLPRGLAKCFRNPIIWGVLPLVVFTSLHWSPASSLAMNLSVMISIGAFAVVLMVLVYATGNLGASFGAHLGNNIFGFLLISHQQNYSAFSLFAGRSLEGPSWTAIDAAALAAIGLIASGLTALLLFHASSPLRVRADLG